MARGTDQAIDKPAVLLTGASSQIGIFAIPRLLVAGFRVIALSRKGKPEGFPALEQVEWLTGSGAADVSQNCHYLLSAGPLELAQKYLQRGLHFRSAVVFSSSSVETKLESRDATESSQVEKMLNLESELRSRAEDIGLKLVIFRPTLIYGCGLDTNISRLADWIRRFGFIPLNGRAKGLRQPVHADDLASLAIAAMLSRDALPGVLTVTGGETLSYSDMVTRVFVALGRPVRLVHLPEWSLLWLLRGLHVFKLANGINREMIRRQNVDLVFDDQQARALLGYKPRPFAPVEADFALPYFK